jgi:hypothetical protein
LGMLIKVYRNLSSSFTSAPSNLIILLLRKSHFFDQPLFIKDVQGSKNVCLELLFNNVLF